MELLDILENNLLKKYSYNDIAKNINISIGTIKRWVLLRNVPNAYRFELMKMANIEIDYSKYDYKEKDQFFTPHECTTYCFDIWKKIIKDYGEQETEYTYIEPSAGSGNFLKLFPKDRRIGIDIEPRNDEIQCADFLDWKPPYGDKKYVVFGNPPFGLRGQLALKFILHSYEFADYVCFILPQLFESDGKGVPRKRIQNYHLIHSEKINTDFQNPEGKCIKIECIFQIWSKYHVNQKYELLHHSNASSSIKVYSLSDGGTPSSTRNKKMFYKCDVYLPSTCFGEENMKYYDCFDDLPLRRGYGVVFENKRQTYIKKCKKISWKDVAFLSTNSAYNLRSSQIISQFT